MIEKAFPTAPLKDVLDQLPKGTSVETITMGDYRKINGGSGGKILVPKDESKPKHCIKMFYPPIKNGPDYYQTWTKLVARELRAASVLGGVFLAPVFYGLVATNDGEIGFKQEFVSPIFDFVRLESSMKMRYHLKVEELMKLIFSKRLVCLGDIELYINTLDLDEVRDARILLLDLSAVISQDEFPNEQVAWKRHLETFRHILGD